MYAKSRQELAWDGITLGFEYHGDLVLNIQSSSKTKKSSTTTNPEASDNKKQPKEIDKTADEIQVNDEKAPNETTTEQSTKDTEEHKTEE